MKTFYDFLQNNNNVIFQEQNPIVDPLVSGFAQGVGLTPELEKIGKRTGEFVKKTGQGIGRALFGQKNNKDQGLPPESMPQIGAEVDLREIRKQYFELQNALKNYYNVISNNPSMKSSPQITKVQSMLQKIENELDITYRMLYQTDQKPVPLKGVIRP
jgi:hypothetical protein